MKPVLVEDYVVDDEDEATDTIQAEVDAPKSSSYSWEAGYAASWFRNRSGASDARKQTFVLFRRQQKESVDVTEVQPLPVDAEKRIRRPYMEAFEGGGDLSMIRSAPGSSIRSLVIVLDFSESMNDLDLKPNRMSCVVSILEEFVDEFFETSPMSRLAIVTMADQDARVIHPMGGSADTLKATLTALVAPDATDVPSGCPSVQAALERSLKLLEASPSYSSREILVLFGSCMTIDAGSLESTVQTLAERSVRVAVVSLAPELRIMRKLSTDTDGDFVVALNRPMLRQSVLAQTVSNAKPPDKKPQEAAGSDLVMMGFPDLKTMSTVSLCVCHNRLSFKGYTCPQCLMKSCSLPTTCKACGLPLVLATDLVRCGSRGFLAPPYLPVPSLADLPNIKCYLCCRRIISGGGQCPACGNVACFECDVLVHTLLKRCPSCTSRELKQRQQLLPCPTEGVLPLVSVAPNTPDTSLLTKVVLVQRKRAQMCKVSTNGR